MLKSNWPHTNPPSTHPKTFGKILGGFLPRVHLKFVTKFLFDQESQLHFCPVFDVGLQLVSRAHQCFTQNGKNFIYFKKVKTNFDQVPLVAAMKFHVCTNAIFNAPPEIHYDPVCWYFRAAVRVHLPFDRRPQRSRSLMKTNKDS